MAYQVMNDDFVSYYKEVAEKALTVFN
jgi:hypothetical protein